MMKQSCSTFLNLAVYVVVCWVLHVEGRHVKRACKSSEIDIMTSTGAKIEPWTLSRVQLPRLSKTFSSDGHKLSFEFKTTSQSGLLFYGTMRNRRASKLIVLQLVRGKLFYTTRCPSADSGLLLPTPYRLDDGKWHTVEFRREGRKGYIILDNQPYFKTYPVTCKLTSFVFGGLEPVDAASVLPLLRTSTHFDGCIRNLSLNIDHGLAPRYYAVSICS
ncbi:sex hormone-binding globulin-like isoform X2 [Haliotis cracherodii]|uniref:sex hormone-binding globulin-like isoform X2 n=1 Tax=Haliotis cracherodii TaxID=6455 RepID=UPI0039EC7A1A